MTDPHTDGNQHERGLCGDPGADRTTGDDTRDQKCLRCSELEAELSRLQPYVQHLPTCELREFLAHSQPNTKLIPVVGGWRQAICSCGLIPPQAPQ